MSAILNVPVVLSAIGSNPNLFADAMAEMNKAAVAIVTVQLKSKGLSLPLLTQICRALGVRQFELTLDHLPPKAVTSLVKKLDPHHPDKGAADAIWGRKHVQALAVGDVGPASEPEKRTEPKKKGGPKKKTKLIEDQFWPTAMTAVGTRKKT